MHDDYRRRVESLFHRARALPPDQRGEFLDSQCAGDKALRREVHLLLQADDEATAGFLATAEGVGAIAGPLAAGKRERIGPYQILAKLGEGGFGVVYLAERREPYTQRVALKVIKPGMDSHAVIARFEQERQALAVMDHPNVAKVLDAGVSDAGRPYFVMELVKGEPITGYCDRNRLSIRHRLGLFITVCEAVQHAHMKGIIHRDIKPSNILVASPGEGGDAGAQDDQAGVVKVIDFGVAKAISRTLTQKTVFTEQGQLIGTPEYMSPEQAEMGATDIDTRTDVYSLGVLLYELLTGALPFEPEELRSKAFGEIQRIIREVDPPKPSTRLTALGETALRCALNRRSRLGDLAGQLRQELEWIPLRALRKDRRERYQTALDLADDVRNYLAGRPLVAGPVSALYRARKFVRRNKGSVATAATIALLLVAGIVGTTYGMVQANRQRALAEQRLAQGRELADSLLGDVLGSVERLVGSTRARRALVDAVLAYLQPLTEAADGQSSLRPQLIDAYKRLGGVAGGTMVGNQGDTALAAHAYRRALELAELDAAERPDYAEARRRLGVARLDLSRVVASQGDAAKSRALREASLELFERLAGELPDDELAQAGLVAALLDTADAAEAVADFDAAVAHCERALEVCRRMMQRYPQSDRHAQAASSALLRLGFLAGQSGHTEEAERHHREMMGIREQIAQRSPDDAVAQRDAMLAKYYLSDSIQRAGDVDQAEALLNEALAIGRRLYEEEVRVTLDVTRVSNVDALSDLLLMLRTLAELEFWDRENYAAAAGHYAETVRVASQLADADPENRQRRWAHADSLMRLGEAEGLAGNTDAAIRFVRESLTGLEEAHRAAPDDVQLRFTLAWAHCVLCLELRNADDLRAARAAGERSVELYEGGDAAGMGDVYHAMDYAEALKELSQTLWAMDERDAARARVAQAKAVAASLPEDTHGLEELLGWIDDAEQSFAASALPR